MEYEIELVATIAKLIAIIPKEVNDEEILKQLTRLEKRDYEIFKRILQTYRRL
jgi:hypothetical protein